MTKHRYEVGEEVRAHVYSGGFTGYYWAYGVVDEVRNDGDTIIVKEKDGKKSWTSRNDKRVLLTVEEFQKREKERAEARRKREDDRADSRKASNENFREHIAKNVLSALSLPESDGNMELVIGALAKSGVYRSY